MTDAPTEHPDDVNEADRWEQELPAGEERERQVPVPEADDHVVPEASDGDLAESAIEVDLDDEDEVR